MFLNVYSKISSTIIAIRFIYLSQCCLALARNNKAGLPTNCAPADMIRTVDKSACFGRRLFLQNLIMKSSIRFPLLTGPTRRIGLSTSAGQTLGKL